MAAARAMGALLALLLAAAVAPQLSAAQPVTASVNDEGAEAVSNAIQLAISEQDGKTAAQLIAQAIAAKEKPSLAQVIKPQQQMATPKVLPETLRTQVQWQRTVLSTMSSTSLKKMGQKSLPKVSTTVRRAVHYCKGSCSAACSRLQTQQPWHVDDVL
jgi:hypothetical protein